MITTVVYNKDQLKISVCLNQVIMACLESAHQSILPPSPLFSSKCENMHELNSQIEEKMLKCLKTMHKAK